METIKVSQAELEVILSNLKGYKFVNLSYTTPLAKKMVKKDRITKETNPLINGFVSKVLNVATLGTTKDGLSGYQMRAENNNKGAEFESFKEAWFKYLSPILVTDKKTETKRYFVYEKVNRSFFTKYILNGAIYTKQIGDVWNKVSDNKRGVNIRVVQTDYINRMTIDGKKYIVVR